MDSPPNHTQTNCIQTNGQCRVAFTVLELLVSITVVGVLITMLLPTLMHARESARRTVCTSHLRQVGIAINRHHDICRRLPPAWQVTEHDTRFAYGWAVHLVQELDLPNVRSRLALDRAPWPLESRLGGAVYSVPLLICPSDIIEPLFDLLGASLPGANSHVTASHSADDNIETLQRLLTLPTANYVGVYGTAEADEFYETTRTRTEFFSDGSVVNDRRVRFADLRRGLSNTLLVGERTMATVPSTWLGVDLRGQDAECRLVGSAMTRPNCGLCDECEFSSRHVKGVNFLWADGHVTLLNDHIDSVVYRQLARRGSH